MLKIFKFPDYKEDLSILGEIRPLIDIVFNDLLAKYRDNPEAPMKLLHARAYVIQRCKENPVKSKEQLMGVINESLNSWIPCKK